MAKRIEKVNELVKEVVSSAIHRSLQFPEGALVTVTRVVTSSDIHYANVFVTVFTKVDSDAAAALRVLRAHAGAIQRALNTALRMRPVPRIAFFIDADEERRERIETLLGAARREEGKT